jgi:hypothetical protein
LPLCVLNVTLAIVEDLRNSKIQSFRDNLNKKLRLTKLFGQPLVYFCR